MKAIDVSLLQEHGVCHEQIAGFIRAFGEGARVVPTLELCLKHADQFDWKCVALHSPEQRAKHLKRVAALAVYEHERKRLLEMRHCLAIEEMVAAYDAATVDARAVRDAAQRDAADMRDWATRAALDAFDPAKPEGFVEALARARLDYDERAGAADDAYYADPRVEPAWSNRAKLDNERAAALADLARQHNEMLAKLWFEGIADSLGGEEREG